MPHPVSDNEMTTSPVLLISHVTNTEPLGGVNLTAFDVKFSKT